LRAYELMYVIRPDLDDEAANAVVERFNGIITNNGGEVESATRWGRRRLAYEVKKFREGLYMLVLFKGEPAVERELERLMKISDEVIRFMVIRRDE